MLRDLFERVAPAMLWISSCIPAGAMAGAGLIEFNWDGGPPYDGGFMGYLVFFGGFLAIGQSAFVPFVFGVPDVVRGALFTVSWVVAGFFGWTLGSVAKAFLFAESYTLTGILPTSLPWLSVGLLQGTLILLHLRSSSSSLRVHGLIFVLVWSLVVTACGIIFEELLNRSFDGRLMPSLTAVLYDLGLAPGISETIIPFALIIPLVYGLPTGIVLSVLLREDRNSPARNV